jgi:mutator protein MutT
MALQKDIFVKVLIKNPSGEILMLKRGKEARSDSGLMDFPGGKVEAGEEAIEAIIREVREETSLTLYEYQKLCQKNFKHPNNKSGNVIIWYTAKTPYNTVVLNGENSEYKWVKPKEIMSELKGVALSAHGSAVETYLGQLPK